MSRSILVPPDVRPTCAHNIHFNCLSTVLEWNVCVIFNRTKCFMVIKRLYLFKALLLFLKATF